MTENRQYRTQQYAVRADVDAEGLLKVRLWLRYYQGGPSVALNNCSADIRTLWIWDGGRYRIMRALSVDYLLRVSAVNRPEGSFWTSLLVVFYLLGD